MEATPGPDGVRPPWRLGPRLERWLDVALVLALALPAPLYLLAGVPFGVPLALVQTVPLWWRRGHPDVVFVAVAAASALQVVLIDTPLHSQVAFVIALYSVARFSTPLAGWLAAVVGVAAAAVASADWVTGFGGDLTTRTFLPYFLTIGAIVVTVWSLGTLARTRRAYVDALLERHERTRLEAEQRVALAASAERARIARELHDVVAHGLSVMVVQSDGARYAAAHDPQVATDALARIGVTGRQALTDMRQLLGLLREDEATTRSPLPGLADLPALLAEAETGGTVAADLAGLDRAVPPAVGLTTYRVVQEALSNVRKHAGPGATAQVRVAVGDEVAVEVVDDGRGAAATDPVGPHGHGLTGMRERIDVHGGRLVTGPRPGGGWAVHASIPL